MVYSAYNQTNGTNDWLYWQINNGPFGYGAGTPAGNEGSGTNHSNILNIHGGGQQNNSITGNGTDTYLPGPQKFQVFIYPTTQGNVIWMNSLNGGSGASYLDTNSNMQMVGVPCQFGWLGTSGNTLTIDVYDMGPLSNLS